MKPCRVCGEFKEEKDFYRLRYFYRYNKSNVRWCQDCQKMFMEMKVKEEQDRKFNQVKLTNLVTFD